MHAVKTHIDQAVCFINSHRTTCPAPETKKLRTDWIHTLNRDLDILDASSWDQRKQYIQAVQNLIDQLETLFEKTRVILLGCTSTRNQYLPDNRDSLYALGTAYN